MYRDQILELFKTCPLDIDLNIVVGGRVPQNASSEFLTNKELECCILAFQTLQEQEKG